MSQTIPHGSRPKWRQLCLGVLLGALLGAAGACLMCAEIIGARTVAPYFGSNVFVWGGVFSVFMGGLAFGYRVGGRLADRWPRAWLLAGLLALAGAWILVVPRVDAALNAAVLRLNPGAAFNRLLPLVAVLVLYFVPTALIGMATPMAIRIASTALASLGRIVGLFYALSTLGSVAGALVTTFGLAPAFGNRAILTCCGAVLVACGAAGAAAALLLGRTAAMRNKAAPAFEPEPKVPAERVPGLWSVVLGCGMVLMSLEVLGGLTIAPYFGSNVAVWGSVITVFLGGLALGYGAGGVVADRWPSMRALATVVLAAGVATLLVPIIAAPLCNALLAVSFGGWRLVRPLLATLLLFLLPTGLLAMIAPFAVRLSTRRVGAVGGIAGRLYALSTLGNVVGLLVTTYVLISVVGKTHLLELAGLATVAIAVAAVLRHDVVRDEDPPWAVGAATLLAALALALAPKPPLVPLAGADEEVVGTVADPGRDWHVIRSTLDPTYFLLRRIRAERESPYHHVAVIEEKTLPTGVPLATREGRTFRVGRTTAYGNRRELRFDQYVESAVLLDDEATHIRSPYTSGTTYSDMLHLPLIFQPDVKDVLIVGGGGGVVPMVFKKSYPGVKLDVVEIDPVVADVARKWFGMTEDDRLDLHIQDGRMLVHNTQKR
jgi:hypothetical protein